MNYKIIFILFFVSLLLLGVSYSTEVSNDTNMADISKSPVTTEKVMKNNNMNIKEENNLLIENKAKKLINKQDSTTVKSAIKYNVDCFDTLYKALGNDKYDTLTLNIKSDINLTNNTLINPQIKTLKINGNGKTINAKNKYQFLNTRLNRNIDILLTNIHLTNYHIDSSLDNGVIIYNSGNLTLDKCTFVTSKFYKHATTIRNAGNLTVNNCSFNGFSELEVIKNTGTLTVNNSIFKESIINSNTLIVKNSIFKQNSLEDFGAIKNQGTLIADNCTFKSVDANFGGAIHNKGRADLNNCTFDCCGAEEGGAIMNYKKLSINNSIFTRCMSWTGAIGNTGTLKINNSRFSENGVPAEDMGGGAIYNNGNLTVHNSIFENNSATSGGAIYDEGKLSIYNSTFNDNKAEVPFTELNGGAIYTCGNNTVIKYCIFHNNTATENGGAIYNYGSEKIDITGNIFSENNAKEGSAIYSGLKLKHYYDDKTPSIKIKNTGSNLNIYNNTFMENKAKSTKNVISIKGNSTLDNNTFYPYSEFNSTIYSEAKNTRIIKNIFTIIADTKITINKVPDTQYTNNVIIKGSLKTIHGYKLANQTISIKVNGLNIANTKTNVNGIYTYKYQTTAMGKNILTVSYKANNIYKAASNKTTFKVTQKATKITINKIADTEYENNLIIKGTLKTTNGKPIQSTNLTIKINDKTVGTSKTNKNGIFTYKYNAKTMGKNNITISFTAYKGYKKTTAQTTFKVTAKRTKITINSIPKTKLGKTIKIRGRFTDTSGKAFKNVKLTVKVNSRKFITKTDANGTYTLSYKTTKKGTNNLTISFEGNTKYLKTSTSKKFKVIS